jgi:hypothetical protein
MVPIEVQLSALQRGAVAGRGAAVEVVFGDITLRVATSTDVEYVRALVAALRGSR